MWGIHAAAGGEKPWPPAKPLGRSRQCGRDTRPVGETLRGSARVAMMEAADHGRRDDLAPVGRHRPSGLRGVLVEGQMSPGPVVVGEIRVQHVAQVGVVEHHHVIEALAAQGPDETLHVGILPGACGAIVTSWIPRAFTRHETTAPNTASRSRSRYRGAVSHGNASASCWAVHWAVGASVTLTWTTRRRSCARTTKTNNTLNITVGTVKKSTETSVPT